MQSSQPSQKKFYLQSKTKKDNFTHYPIKSKVLQYLADNLFTEPTLVQAQSLPITLQENLRNLCVIVYAYNGAGKTLTYLLPIFNSLQNIPCVGQKILKNQDHQIGRPQAIIVVPTQALLAQVYDYLTTFAQFFQNNFNWKITIGKIYGTQTKNNGHIIVGLARKMMQKFKLGGKFDFSELKWIVFDQCDKVKEDTLSQFEDMLKLFADPKTNAANANLLITSATGDKDNFRHFIQDNLTSHNILQLDAKQQNKGLIGVTHMYSKSQNKDTVIFNLLQKISKIQTKPQVIIFFNSIHQLRSFYQLLKKQRKQFVINDPNASQSGKNNLKVDYIHGQCSNGYKGGNYSYPQDYTASKTTRIGRLRNKEVQVMLGTQTIGRGIDIRTVTLVINYSQPIKGKGEICPTAYIHRVGRTGRHTDQGIALTFVANQVFVRLAQEQQKIKFMQMSSQDEVIKLTVGCTNKNLKQMAEEEERNKYVQ